MSTEEIKKEQKVEFKRQCLMNAVYWPQYFKQSILPTWTFLAISPSIIVRFSKFTLPEIKDVTLYAQYYFFQMFSKLLWSNYIGYRCLSPFVPVDLKFLASYWPMTGVCTWHLTRCISLLGGVCQFSTILLKVLSWRRLKPTLPGYPLQIIRPVT